MPQLSSRTAIAAGLACSLLLGCGGKVVFQEDDGSGGSGGQGAAGPGPGPGPNTTVSTGSVIPTNLCQEFCGDYAQCLGSPCLDQCISEYGLGCDEQIDAFLACAVRTFDPSCEFIGCSEEVSAYADCLNGSQACVTDGCDDGGPPGNCYCSGTCFGTTFIEQACFFPVPGGPGDPPPPPDGVLCDCYLDGAYVGNCETGAFDCSIEGGCCQFYAIGIK